MVVNVVIDSIWLRKDRERKISEILRNGKCLCSLGGVESNM